MKGKFGITVLGSGSRGNASVIHGPDGAILLDAGFSAKEIEKRLQYSGIEPQSIQAVLITHGHGDHTKGCRAFADRYKICSYFTAATRHEGERCKFLPEKQAVIAPGSSFEIAGITVEPFTLPHDAVDTVGYVFQAYSRKIGVATDLGHLNMLARQKLKGCTLLVLESNHDPQMLQASTRPIQLKRRILSRHGHLSNADALSALDELLTEESTSLVLAHLSSECNNRELVEKLAAEKLAGLNRQDIFLRIAVQDQPLATLWAEE
ncbi:MAG: MBL fold metallo-hydrolase [Lentisphaeria bacterium]|nr:MBL fold metallo-hydrolase [Lentisphaeria bacterium]